MKKLIYLVVALLIMGTTSFGQDKGAKKAAPVKEAPAAAPKMKKDGTPDMRHKENKEKAEAAKPTQKMKKDGTPDKRFKENKAVEPKKK